MAYSPPQFSRSRVNRAGRALASQKATLQDRIVINDWRTSHALPLNTAYMGMKRLAGPLDTTALYSQRIKRLPSIEIKFARNPNMQMTRMQDLGGCRAVMAEIDLVHKLQDRYSDSRSKTLRAVRTYDYLSHPKKDGYRGIHIVLKYTGTTASAYDGQFIEVQLRSRLQHGWAMAVETVDHLLDQDLKIGGGNEDWKRFFVLMGSAHSLEEATTIIPDAPSDPGTLAKEIKSLTQKLRVKHQLQGFQTAQRAIDHEDLRNMDYFLMELRAKDQTTIVRGYKQREVEAAREKFLELENQSDADVVLVRVQDVQALKQAYPSYFLDTTFFLGSLDKILRHA